jgi:uncharacterized membrane protein
VLYLREDAEEGLIVDVNRRILMAVAEVDVWVLAARRVGVIVALLVGAAAVLCGAAWIVGRCRNGR